MANEKKKFKVVIHFEGAMEYEVEAKSEEEAELLATNIFDEETPETLISNLGDSETADIWEIKEPKGN